MSEVFWSGCWVHAHTYRMHIHVHTPPTHRSGIRPLVGIPSLSRNPSPLLPENKIKEGKKKNVWAYSFDGILWLDSSPAPRHGSGSGSGSGRTDPDAITASHSASGFPRGRNASHGSGPCEPGAFHFPRAGKNLPPSLPPSLPPPSTGADRKS